MIKLRTLLYVALCVLLAYTSWQTYSYFFDTTAPVVELVGLADESYHAGDISCTLQGSDAYKVQNITILLDDTKYLIRDHRVRSRRFEFPFTIPTSSINQGKHTLKYIVTDASYNKNKTEQTLHFYADNNPLQVALITRTDDLKVFQGRVLHIQFQTNKIIKKATCRVLAKEYACYAESPGSLIYECYVPVPVDELPNEYIASIEITDNVENNVTLDQKYQVIAYPFKNQTLRLDVQKVKQENESGLSAQQFETDMEAATKQSPAKKMWSGAFYVPCEMRAITTDFGTLRITQHKGKYSHNAVDLSAQPRSLVWASQDGVVVIKNRYGHSGNTIVVDHGYGLLSCYFHLETYSDINVGDTIKKGRPVGTLGMTGHASGYHLHWEMRLQNIQIDPMQWTKTI